MVHSSAQAMCSLSAALAAPPFPSTGPGPFTLATILRGLHPHSTIPCGRALRPAATWKPRASAITRVSRGTGGISFLPAQVRQPIPSGAALPPCQWAVDDAVPLGLRPHRARCRPAGCVALVPAALSAGTPRESPPGPVDNGRRGCLRGFQLPRWIAAAVRLDDVAEPVVSDRRLHIHDSRAGRAGLRRGSGSLRLP